MIRILVYGCLVLAAVAAPVRGQVQLSALSSGRWGEEPEAGEGTLDVSVHDPLTDESYTVVSSVSGEIIGMAFSRPVLSGYALYHVAWHTPD